MFFFIAEQLHEILIVLCERGFSASGLTERKGILAVLLALAQPAVIMHIDAFARVLCSADDDRIAFLDIAEFYDANLFTVPDRYRVHAAVLRQIPLAVYLKIFRKD